MFACALATIDAIVRELHLLKQRRCCAALVAALDVKAVAEVSRGSESCCWPSHRFRNRSQPGRGLSPGEGAIALDALMVLGPIS
jgi:hypothetical protein